MRASVKPISCALGDPPGIVFGEADPPQGDSQNEKL
jgi:hypothetical protein